MNPCPCGYFGDPVKKCSCAHAAATRYQKRISGPLLDRIDIHMEVPRVDYDKLTNARLGESSETNRFRVESARERQQERFRGSHISTNADMRPADVRIHCLLDKESQTLVQSAMRQMQLSARAYHRILKLARTTTSSLSVTGSRI